MQHFGAFEAKTHFSELLASVMKGEKVVITKHGIEVAMIVPYSKEKQKNDTVGDAIRAIKNLRKGITLGSKLSIRELREEGRR